MAIICGFILSRGDNLFIKKYSKLEFLKKQAFPGRAREREVGSIAFARDDNVCFHLVSINKIIRVIRAIRGQIILFS